MLLLEFKKKAIVGEFGLFCNLAMIPKRMCETNEEEKVMLSVYQYLKIYISSQFFYLLP